MTMCTLSLYHLKNSREFSPLNYSMFTVNISDMNLHILSILYTFFGGDESGSGQKLVHRSFQINLCLFHTQYAHMILTFFGSNRDVFVEKLCSLNVYRQKKKKSDCK